MKRWQNMWMKYLIIASLALVAGVSAPDHNKESPTQESYGGCTMSFFVNPTEYYVIHIAGISEINRSTVFPQVKFPLVGELDLSVRATKRSRASEGSDQSGGLEQGVIPPLRNLSSEGREIKKLRLGN